MKKVKYAVLGGGNGGQCIAAYLTLKGYETSIYDRYANVINPIKEKGGIELTGVSLNGFANIGTITTDIGEAIDGADAILVVLPAFAHAYIAQELAPLLKDNQIILLCPGSSGGVLEFRKILQDQGCKADIKIGETSSLFYASRAKDGVANIGEVKKNLMISALPSEDADYIIEFLKDVYPDLIKVDNILYTYLCNLNAIIHPIPMILSTSWIEATGGDFRFYLDSITPTVGKMVEKIDAERLAIGKALGMKLKSTRESLESYYGASGDSIYEAVRTVEGYKTIMVPPNLQSRFLLEDVPMGLVPMTELAKLVGVETPIMDTVIHMASILVDRDLKAEGRTLERLGISHMNVQELREYVR